MRDMYIHLNDHVQHTIESDFLSMMEKHLFRLVILYSGVFEDCLILVP